MEHNDIIFYSIYFKTVIGETQQPGAFDMKFFGALVVFYSLFHAFYSTKF